MLEWDAEVTIDEALVLGLLAEQFPELDASSARLLGEGWDNSVWVVEEAWAFPFPRREIAIPGVERELALLPRLAPLLPVAIPVPRFVGVPSTRFHWPFFGTRLLPGREPADAELTDHDRVELGAELGRFLRVLHDVQLDLELPVDFNRRADMPYQAMRTRQRIPELALAESATATVVAMLADAETLPPSRHTVLVHGDFHVRHVLVNRGTVTGIIDWGDICFGDPSIDLQVAWTLLPTEARSRFFEEYGPVDEERQLRARVFAVGLSAMLALYARAVGNAALERECLDGLERAVAA